MRQEQSRANRCQANAGCRGVTLLIAAFGLVFLLSAVGMAVDLAYLYCGRAEAQHAADAAALAAAHDFASSGYTSGVITMSQVETLAATDAAQVGNSNLVGGQSPQINPDGFSSTCPPPPGSDGCFDMTKGNDPLVTVVVQRTKERGNPMNLFFMKIFGLDSADVSASSTAEAYNPSQGNSPPVDVQSIKPWLVPNCDPSHTYPVGDPRGNPNCVVSGGLASYYVYPQDSDKPSELVNPGLTPTGVAGLQIVLKPGSPSMAAAPSQFYPLYLPHSDQSRCPVCASASTSSDGPGSASLYEDNIECLTPWQYTCGPTPIQLTSGNMVGPTSAGVDCLIHEVDGAGQDTLDLSTTPFHVLTGTLNPYFPAGSPVTTSDSMVTVPLYDGSVLCSGGSCGRTVTVEGFLQLFVIQEGPPQGSVTAYVLNVAGCGNWQTSNSIPATANPADPIVVRLIHN